MIETLLMFQLSALWLILARLSNNNGWDLLVALVIAFCGLIATFRRRGDKK